MSTVSSTPSLDAAVALLRGKARELLRLLPECHQYGWKCLGPVESDSISSLEAGADGAKPPKRQRLEGAAAGEAGQVSAAISPTVLAASSLISASHS